MEVLVLDELIENFVYVLGVVKVWLNIMKIPVCLVDLKFDERCL